MIPPLAPRPTLEFEEIEDRLLMLHHTTPADHLSQLNYLPATTSYWCVLRQSKVPISINWAAFVATLQPIIIHRWDVPTRNDIQCAESHVSSRLGLGLSFPLPHRRAAFKAPEAYAWTHRQYCSHHGKIVLIQSANHLICNVAS